MLKLTFKKNDSSINKILCLGAHSDDIEIGCGGTILRLTQSEENTEIYWVVFTSDKQREQEARYSANLFLNNATKKNIVIKNFKDGFFPFVGDQIKEYIKQIRQQISPDIIFTHYREDLHQDHRLISDLTWNIFRDHFILEYEIAKYDGDLGKPNLFVNLDKSICQQKIQYIINAFKTQQKHQWFDQESFFSLLRLRGVESNSPSKYSEAFYCRKVVL